MTTPNLTETLAVIWRRILEVDDDGSFYDAGGDSLKAVRLLYEIEEETGLEIDIAWLLDHPTLGELQEHATTLSPVR